MSSQLKENAWPAPLRHCAQPLEVSSDEHVVIGEVTSEPINGFAGTRLLYTALVPLEQVDAVLKAVGGIGHGVFSKTRHQTFLPKGDYIPSIWVAGGDDNTGFQTIIHTWGNHNKTVLLPDSALLERFQLIPRVANNGDISWDDPAGPVYDVVRVTPLSHYSPENGQTVARIKILRAYLEDYLSQENCAAIATYFDERFSSDDPEVAALISNHGNNFKQPGRELWFMSVDRDSVNQLSQVWGCSLLLNPTGRPISNPPDVELWWPDRSSSIKGEGRQTSFGIMERAYVRDEVLFEYEQRNEFEISPEHGFVSYDNRWSVSYCERFGRNHIGLELRKLYEGAPLNVIQHYNQFAVKSEIAEKDRQTYGTRHVGIRARELIYAFLQLTLTLSELSDAVGFPCAQEDVGQFETGTITYRGWWTFPEFKSLGHIIPLSLPYSLFLSRCKEIVKLLENLRPGPIRNILIKLGLEKETIKDFAAIKLLATLCQLAEISVHEGLDLVADCAQISSKWDASVIITNVSPFFSLLTLRTADAHKVSSSTPSKVADALKVFGIDESQCHAGWGLALDKVYDKIVSSLIESRKLIGEA